MVSLPRPRGATSEFLLGHLPEPLHRLPSFDLPACAEPLEDDDLQLSLYLCYELHYRGLPGVGEDWEWEPSLLDLRRRLERTFEDALERTVPRPPAAGAAAAMDLALRALLDADESPSLARYVQRRATADEVRELVVHRSAYQLKEADPHSWVVPRLAGRPKAAIVEIQADEYGGGHAERIHAELFAREMRALGLDSSYGAYLDCLPGTTLATVNVMSLFGLHRRWRGAVVGHLAVGEMSSAVPNRRYGDGLRRLGFGADATEFHDEHVTADAVHESIAGVDMAGGLALQDPALVSDILWGAAAMLELEGRFARRLLGAWEAGTSSLLSPLPSPAAA
jgi:hypothetical protein